MSIADEVFELFDLYGSNTYSEQVSIVAHSRQAAALAREAGASDGLVVAALLHDVGHLLSEPDSEFGVTDHGTSGAACWPSGLSTRSPNRCGCTWPPSGTGASMSPATPIN